MRLPAKDHASGYDKGDNLSPLSSEFLDKVALAGCCGFSIEALQLGLALSLLRAAAWQWARTAI